MENAKFAIPESGGVTIPLPVQSPEAAPTRPTPAAAKVEGPRLLVSAYPGSPERYIDFKIEKDGHHDGVVVVPFVKGIPTAKIAEPVLFDFLGEEKKKVATLDDWKARKASREIKLAEAEKLRRYSDVENISTRLREINSQIENGKKALEHFRTVAGPAAFMASIEAKQLFFDQLRAELDRIDAEIAEAQALHTKLTAKPAAKAEPKQAGAK